MRPIPHVQMIQMYKVDSEQCIEIRMIMNHAEFTEPEFWKFKIQMYDFELYHVESDGTKHHILKISEFEYNRIWRHPADDQGLKDALTPLLKEYILGFDIEQKIRELVNI